MRVIYKYLFHEATTNIIWDENCVVRHVGVDAVGDLLAIWIETSVQAPYKGLRTFKAISTGNEIPEGWEFIGTVVLPRSVSVVHVFAEPT